jgi:hypothetical protein
MSNYPPLWKVVHLDNVVENEILKKSPPPFYGPSKSIPVFTTELTTLNLQISGRLYFGM